MPAFLPPVTIVLDDFGRPFTPEMEVTETILAESVKTLSAVESQLWVFSRLLILNP